MRRATLNGGAMQADMDPSRTRGKLVSTSEARDADRTITLTLAALDQFFNPPAVDPFSEREVEARGESGMSYLMRRVQSHRRDWRGIHVIVRLPADQITPGLASRLPAAVHRYCQVRIDDNTQEIQAIRVRSSIALGALAAIVLVIVAAAYYVFTRVIPNAPEAVQAIVGATICIFAWVVLWDSLEALLFNPIPVARENRLLRKILQLPITVEPNISVSVAPNGHAPDPDARTLAS